VSRGEIWVVSKCSSSRGAGPARENLERQLRELRVEYIDLYYLHSAEPDPAKRRETWAVMEEYYKAGKIKALGISNHYFPEQVDAILKIATVKPVVVQNKFCPFAPGWQYNNCDAVDPIAYFNSLGIVFVSYSTLSGWPFVKLGAISPKVRKTPSWPRSWANFSIF
jgi:diketogulonate reductase-like aldo/keto reductase